MAPGRHRDPLPHPPRELAWLVVEDRLSGRFPTKSADQAAGISPATIRLSIGIEGVNDLIADLDRGLAPASR